MNVRLEILHLKMIKAIAEEKSVTKAADLLGITQSALSHRIKEAENRLGVKLFNRQNKSLKLNLAGERLLYSANHILTELENVEHQIRQDQDSNKQSVRIAIKADSCFHSLPQLIKKATDSAPNLQVDIVTDAIEDPLQALDEKLIDLAIIPSLLKSRKHKIEKLFEDEMFAVLPKGHDNAGKSYLDVKDFSSSTFITHNLVPQKGKDYELFFGLAAARPEKVLQVELTEAIIEMVEAGFGVTILTRWVLEPYLEKHAITSVPLTPKGVFAQWYAVTSNQPSSPAVKMIVNEIKKHRRKSRHYDK